MHTSMIKHSISSCSSTKAVLGTNHQAKHPHKYTSTKTTESLCSAEQHVVAAPCPRRQCYPHIAQFCCCAYHHMVHCPVLSWLASRLQRCRPAANNCNSGQCISHAKCLCTHLEAVMLYTAWQSLGVFPICNTVRGSSLPVWL